MVEKRTCPYCTTGAKVYKNGFKRSTQNYRCTGCGRSFQYEYQQVSRIPGIDELITRRYMEGKLHTDIRAETGANSHRISAVTKHLRGKRTGKSCPKCSGDWISLFGKSRDGKKQRYRCKRCSYTFTVAAISAG